MRSKIVLTSFVAVVVVLACGCKTKVDPNAFEGGAAATPSVDAVPSAATDSDAAAADDASTGLAPLQTGGAAHAVGPTGGGGGSHATTKPATDPPECVQARSPECVGNGRVRVLHPTKACEDAKFACFNKGGHL